MRTRGKPEGYTGPTCVKCESKMVVVRRDPKQVFEHRYEQRTFGCSGCGNEQTYTMGCSSVADQSAR
jgi:hypothetical protein